MRKFIQIKQLIPALMVLLLPFFLTGCGSRETTFQGMAMGTTYMVKVVTPSNLTPDKQQQLQSAIANALEDVEQKMSTYRADSELSKLNQYEGKDLFTLSPETLEVIRQAMQISEESGGAFDITVGPLVNAWGFGPEQLENGGPSEAELEQLLQRVGYKKLTVEKGGVRKSRPDIYCDLSAIAKGYGADRVAAALEKFEVENYLVEVGGEIHTHGHNKTGSAWGIAIEKPEPGHRSIYKILHLNNQSIATSGDYRNYREIDGVRVSHTIDPKTGRPVTHGLASVSVVHKRCELADAYATAMMALGPEKGFELAERKNLAVLFLLHDGKNGFKEKTTEAMEKMLENQAK